MKIYFRVLIVPALLVSFTSAFAGIPECENANPDSAKDVQNCIAKTPEIHYGLQQATINPSICRLTQNTIRSAKKASMPEESIKVPSCDTVAQALTQLNGVRPLWAECTHYDGSQEALNRCTASYLKQTNKNVALECIQSRLLLVGALQGASDSDFDFNKNGPSCEMISKALATQGIQMAGSECLGYRPDDQKHMEQCLKPLILSTQGKITCDELRTKYKLIVSFLTESPENFSLPTCPMLESAVQNVLAAQGTATSNNSVAMPTTPQQIAPQQIPAAMPMNYPPTQQNASSLASGNHPVAQQQEQGRGQHRDSERAAKVQSGIDTAKQIMGTLGRGTETTAPTTNSSSTSTNYNTTNTAPQVAETERKVRETQQKINTATDNAVNTVNAVKGLFNVFGGEK